MSVPTSAASTAQQGWLELGMCLSWAWHRMPGCCFPPGLLSGTQGNGQVLPVVSTSQQFALQVNWCLSMLENSQLENVFRLGEVSAKGEQELLRLLWPGFGERVGWE